MHGVAFCMRQYHSDGIEIKIFDTLRYRFFMYLLYVESVKKLGHFTILPDIVPRLFGSWSTYSRTVLSAIN